jgi:uncharacterized membrane protein SirB2
MTGPGPGPEGTQGGPADPRLARLLRWYPPTWRKRYGDEFLAMVEDTLDGRRPGWRLRLGVARSGLRERGHVLSGPAGKRARSRLGTFAVIGGILAGGISDAGGDPTAAGTWQATAAMTALAVLAAITGAAIVAAVAIAWRPLVRFLRAGGWPKVRRRIIPAAAATAAAAGMLTWLAALQTSMTPGQLATSQTYGIVFIVVTLLFVAAIGLWATAARAVARHLDLAPRIRAAETLLAAVISTGVLTMVPTEIIWFGVIRSSVYWLTGGLLALISAVFAAPTTLRQARRRARRQRAAAARGRAG